MRNPPYVETGYQYDLVTNALRDTGQLGRLKTGIGLLCFVIVFLQGVTQFYPLGPHGTWPRVVHGITAASAVVAGLCWLSFSWPGRRAMAAFVVWADVALAVGAALLSDPTARICAIVYLGPVGLLPTFFLSRRALVAHCAFATSLLGALLAVNVLSGGARMFEQFFYAAPVISAIVLVPAVIQLVLEGGRDSILSAALAADRDPLTGLLNRRGVTSAMDLLHRGRLDAIDIVVVLMDVDGLKELNDTHGHGAGDMTLKAVADMLRARTRVGEIAARFGGDEFLVVAFPGRGEDIESTIRRVSAPRAGVDYWTVSVGAAWQSRTGSKVDLESLVQQADNSLYEAKKTRGMLDPQR